MPRFHELHDLLPTPIASMVPFKSGALQSTSREKKKILRLIGSLNLKGQPPRANRRDTERLSLARTIPPSINLVVAAGWGLATFS
jgi:hypothetical protein